MRKSIYTIILVFVTTFGYAQTDWYLDFQNNFFLNHFYKDTLSNPSCIWQIGKPNKPIFDSARAFSLPNALLTDTINPVPANDTSVFYLVHVRDTNQIIHYFSMEFAFKMDGDSTDFGTIEISPDGGINWINILDEDSTYGILWADKPSLTGSTNGWSYTIVNFSWWAYVPGPYPYTFVGDTVLFRFTYITDSSSTPRDGWMIDDIYVFDQFGSVPEFERSNLISIWPNPTSNQLRIQRQNNSSKENIQVFNSNGNLMIDLNNTFNSTIDTRILEDGIYFLKYTDFKSYCTKKFVIAR
jgi:Secretion system C-terminal sorting domain